MTAAERMRAILDQGRWPSGLPLTSHDRDVIAHNLALAEPRFDGITYDPERDGERLGAQLRRVWDAMADGRWHTLRELAETCGGSEAAISARIRDLRKRRFGGHVVEGEYVRRGLWRYRLTRERAA